MTRTDARQRSQRSKKKSKPGVRAAKAGRRQKVAPPTDLPALTPAQRALADQHIGLVGYHLRMRVPTPRQPRRDREYDDLFQEGCVALVRAAARYDADRHGPFVAYALPRIRGAIHAALYERFSLIHVPARAIAQAAASPGDVSNPGQQPVSALNVDLPIESSVVEDYDLPAESVRHALHHRFERAVVQALESLRNRTWRRRDPSPIMARIAAERLLISQEREKTPLRQIARDANVSSGRASAYEQRLTETVSEYLECDPQVVTLLGFATEDDAGFDGLIDDARRTRLQQAEVDAFEARFIDLERPARAQLLYDLIEQSSAAITEIARNLYRMTHPATTTE